MYRTIAVVLVSTELVFTTGCVNPDGTQNNTGTGALLGGALGALAGAAAGGRHAGEHALVGALAGAVVGGLVGNMMDQEQQERLRQQSPQTLVVIQHNDAVVQQQQQATPAPTQEPAAQAAPPAEAVIPLTVDDIKALASAGVKKDAITQEIEVSKAKFSPQDIAAAQQANLDPAVIECMKSHPS
jgi:outer membrane lipoprotein SlyB